MIQVRDLSYAGRMFQGIQGAKAGLMPLRF